MKKLEKRFGSAVQGIDFRKTDPASLHPDFTEQALQATIHVLADGEVYKGAAALVRIGRLHPVWRRFVWAYRIPVVRWCMETGYAWLARHRFALSRWFKQPPDCGDACVVQTHRKQK